MHYQIQATIVVVKERGPGPVFKQTNHDKQTLLSSRVRWDSDSDSPWFYPTVLLSVCKLFVLFLIYIMSYSTLLALDSLF
jgi:hypothetical protein